ncbi:ABC transporter permease [Pyrococcus abyssi]|uniref:Binding protein-dependent transport system, inner membrane component n=1 Tax=Pyrococcus abyssi (strain GE5 / Orsay) TaxID=272844 RepID=Q9V2D1_PYRAB|nr:ABC transporter permease [Pyrococcus abyssi]CAB49067.1 Binding protein-dependent transport system, inner membrane component [Pyrococcus abyssi GE5]CCE69519.1 TPA: dipeptide ABC transporter, dipeptide-binding protein [Pyrococcus abyssi GE5]
MKKEWIIKKILSLLIPIFIVSVFSFSILHLIPGDPARYLLGEFATEEQLAKFRHQLGLDRPLYIQYIDWMSKVLRGDFGTSLVQGVPVSELIAGRLSYTLKLTVTAWIIAWVFGLVFGMLAAVYKHTLFDYIVMTLAVFFMSMPYFWLGILLILIFGVKLGILPISGPGDWRHLILPSLTLGLPQVAVIARLTRANMLDVLEKDYIMTARAKGLPERMVVYKHALRNALIPLVTYMFLQIPWLFGGAVVTETVFGWPGMGNLLVMAIFQRDYPVVQAIVLIIGVLTVIANFLADITYTIIDPRVRIMGGE